MKSASRQMLEKSISAMVSAIEIYNKPDFEYREESFVILAVNAWELLLKSRLLHQNRNKLTGLYVYDGKRIKRGRSGNALTIDLVCAMRRLHLDQGVERNLSALIEIRDTAIHFYHHPSIKYLVYTLGTAALRNYQQLIRDWFGRSLLDYNFFIMPLAFAHSFSTIQLLELEKKPPIVSNLIRSIAEDQRQTVPGDNFHFACEVNTHLVSAKKFAEPGDLVVKIDGSDPNAKLAIALPKSKLDQYPLSFNQLVERVQGQRPAISRNDICEIIKNLGIKNDTRYAAYSFRTKQHEEQYKATGKVQKGTTSIYREDAVRLIVENIDTQHSRAS